MDDVTLYIYKEWFWRDPEDEDSVEGQNVYAHFPLKYYDASRHKDWMYCIYVNFYYKHAFLMEHNEHIHIRV